jgi:membrane protease YdiL (CAAX protease family)
MSVIRPYTENSTGFRLAVVVEGSLGLAAVGLAALFGVSLRDQLAATPAGFRAGGLLGVVATLPMLAMFWWMVSAKWKSFVELNTQVTQLVRELFPRARLVELALIAVLAGVSEELLFRGVLQTVVAQWTTPLIGLAVASLVFGGLHAISRLYFVLATLIGVYFGGLLLECDDLTVPIVAHGLYDFVALVYLTRARESEVRSERHTSEDD